MYEGEGRSLVEWIRNVSRRKDALQRRGFFGGFPHGRKEGPFSAIPMLRVKRTLIGGFRGQEREKKIRQEVTYQSQDKKPLLSGKGTCRADSGKQKQGLEHRPDANSQKEEGGIAKRAERRRKPKL